jgi:hypothetical protein
MKFLSVISRVARFFLGKYTKTGKNLPKYHKISVYMAMTYTYQMVGKYSEWPQNTVYQLCLFQGPPMYTQMGFWVENIPSGKTGYHHR